MTWFKKQLNLNINMTQIVVCFYANSNYESYERGYKSDLWFEDGMGNKITMPKFILNNFQRVIGYSLTQDQFLQDSSLHSDEIQEVLEDSGWKFIREDYNDDNDAYYVYFEK